MENRKLCSYLKGALQVLSLFKISIILLLPHEGSSS